MHPDIRQLNQERTPTDVFIGISAALGGLTYIWWAIFHRHFHQVGHWASFWATVASVYFLWECWTLANNILFDTISEIVWKVSDRYPLVPALGFGSLLAVQASGLIQDPWILGPLWGLACHFWFPRYGRR